MGRSGWRWGGGWNEDIAQVKHMMPTLPAHEGVIIYRMKGESCVLCK